MIRTERPPAELGDAQDYWDLEREEAAERTRRLAVLLARFGNLPIARLSGLGDDGFLHLQVLFAPEEANHFDLDAALDHFEQRFGR